MGKVALILGILGILLGGAIFVISLLLPVITDGRTSWEEAMIGIIPGALILSFSFLLAIAGVIVILIRRKKAVTSSQ
jgi:hypothetical protein